MRILASPTRIVLNLRAHFGAWLLRRRMRSVFRRFSSFTMVPQEVYVDNLLLARMLLDVEGCVVECGVWRGGMSAGIASILGPNRHYYLFDSFAGLPAAQQIDGPAALAWQSDTSGISYCDNCNAPAHFARQAMSNAGASNFTLVEGWFKDTLPTIVLPEPIALLRLDADWYESTMLCLNTFFERLAPGGIIILDDYYTWDGCSRAVHDYFSQKSACERIRELSGVCYIKKELFPPETVP